MFQAGMKRDFLSSPSFGSGIVRKGIYLMGVFLHSSEHWLVVMASVMTEILWSTQISISTVWFHQLTIQAPCLAMSHRSAFILLLRTRQLNLPKKLCGFSKSRTKRCKWKFIVFQLCFFFDPVMSRGCRPQHSWHQPRLKRRILKYHYDLQTWRSPSIFSLWVLVVCGCRRNYLSWGEREREATLTLESLHSGLSQ